MQLGKVKNEKAKESVIVPDSKVPPELSSWLVLVASHRDKQAFTRSVSIFRTQD